MCLLIRSSCAQSMTPRQELVLEDFQETPITLTHPNHTNGQAAKFVNFHGRIQSAHTMEEVQVVQIGLHAQVQWSLTLQERRSLSCGLLEITLYPINLQETSFSI